jgi:hypothetical protein
MFSLLTNALNRRGEKENKTPTHKEQVWPPQSTYNHQSCPGMWLPTRSLVSNPHTTKGERQKLKQAFALQTQRKPVAQEIKGEFACLASHKPQGERVIHAE